MPHLVAKLSIIVFVTLASFSVLHASEVEEYPDDENDDTEQALPTSCDLQKFTGGVACVGDDGDEFWRIRHPALWEWQSNFADGDDEVESVQLATDGERSFYSVRSDLLEVDASPHQQLEDGRWRGGVVNRWRFPAPIVDLTVVDEDTLEVTVEVNVASSLGLWGEDIEQVTIRQRLSEPQPSQSFWGDIIGMFSSARDGAWLHSYPSDEEEATEAIEKLEKASRLDPTNPYYLLEAGKLYGDPLGDEQAMRQAFEAAVNVEGAPWQDLLRLTPMLESTGESDLADALFERAISEMDEVGIARERISTPVALTALFPREYKLDGGDFPLAHAINDKDVETVHRLSLRRAEVAPNVEGGYQAWGVLADWMAEQGRDDLAEEWRAQAAQNKAFSAVSIEEGARSFDRLLLGLAATFLGLILLCLLVGMRGGIARRRELDEEGDSANDGGFSSQWWVPKLRLRDLIAPLLLFALLSSLPYMMNYHVQAFGDIAAAPVTVLDDSLASPDVDRWLSSFSQSSARDELQAIANAEQQALIKGERFPEKEPTLGLVVETVYDHAKQTQWEAFRSGRIPDVTPMPSMNFAKDSEPSATASGVSAFFALFTLSILAALILIGAVLGSKFPRIGRWILRIIPGGAAILAPLGGVLLVSLLYASLAFTGLDSILTKLGTPNYLSYLDLGELQPASLTPSRGWAWITIGVVAVIHVAVSVWDWKHNE